MPERDAVAVREGVRLPVWLGVPVRLPLRVMLGLRDDVLVVVSERLCVTDAVDVRELVRDDEREADCDLVPVLLSVPLVERVCVLLLDCD